jgi:hypothetical protein
MGIVQYDKDDGDINGTIEVIAKFVRQITTIRAAVYSINSRAVALQGCPPDIAGPPSWLHADWAPREEPSPRFDSAGNA